MTVQLDIYGGETDHVAVLKKGAAFTPAQREILQLIARYGTVTSTAAGRIVHAHREPRCARCTDTERFGRCPWVSSDGGDALKRLMARGLVRRVRPGVWRAK